MAPSLKGPKPTPHLGHSFCDILVGLGGMTQDLRETRALSEGWVETPCMALNPYGCSKIDSSALDGGIYLSS